MPDPFHLLAAAASSSNRGQRRYRRERLATTHSSKQPQTDQDAFKRLYDAHWDDLHAYCHRRCASGADADDVLAETFAIAWRRISDVPDGSSGRPWLFGIARNLLREHYRRGDWVTGVTARLYSELTRGASSSELHRAGHDDLAVTLQALARLREADRETILLIAWEQLTHAEAAEVLGCSTNAVAIRLHRARERLASMCAQLSADSDVKKNLDKS